MDIPSTELQWRSVAVVAEADRIVAHWLCGAQGRAQAEAPYENLAAEAMARADFHFRGPAHAHAVADELLRRAYEADRERAAAFMPGLLF